MQLRELKSGTAISPEIRIDSALDFHGGISLYLASGPNCGHQLVHVLGDYAPDALDRLREAEEFYRDDLEVAVEQGRHEELLYFSEPFPLGEFMFEWLERRERIRVSEALKRVVRLLKVLQKAHDRGLYHGRITPKSILLEQVGNSYRLRLMGIGVAQAMPDTVRRDIDWLDYTFDLEGMSPVAVDVYGMAIVLMGLVSGEQGIDSFEATGLLPTPLRGGILQQTMERALALRMDVYSSVLAFSLDLEAALLELDDRQGEVYVADLVGFEPAVRSISTTISDDQRNTEPSLWSSMFDTLEQEERSSILCSLTSLHAINAVPPAAAAIPAPAAAAAPAAAPADEDEDVTCITTLGAASGQSRIKSTHAATSSREDTVVDADEGDSTSISARPHFTNDSQEVPELKPLGRELGSDEDEDAPTRIMMRPNYASINFGQEEKSVEAAIAAVIEATVDKPEPEQEPEPEAPSMEVRIRTAEVIEAENPMGHDVQYALDDPAAFPPEAPDPSSSENEKTQRIVHRHTPDAPVPRKAPTTAAKPFRMSTVQWAILGVLVVVIIILAIVLIQRIASS